MAILKGNALVGQSGGPTAAINATLAGVIRGAFDAGDVIPTLYGMRNGIEGFLEEKLVNLTEIFSDEKDIKTLELTPAAVLGSCRKKMKSPEDDPKTYEKLIEIFKKYDIRYFFYNKNGLLSGRSRTGCSRAGTDLPDGDVILVEVLFPPVRTAIFMRSGAAARSLSM